MLVITAMLFLVVRKLSHQHRQSEQRLRLEKLRLDIAVNNMTQGLLLFDSSQRLVDLQPSLYRDVWPVAGGRETERHVPEGYRASQGYRNLPRRRRPVLLPRVLRDIGLRQCHDHRDTRRALDPACQSTAGRRRLGCNAGGYHRATPRRTSHRAPGALRCADRPAEPRAVPRAAEARTCASPRASTWRSTISISTSSRLSTTRSAIRPATNC